MTQLWVTADELDDPTLIDAVEAARVASSILYMLSGRKYPGTSRVTEIYEASNGGSICGGLSMRNALSRTVRRASDNYLKLRGNPVRRINELRVGPDRRLVPPTEYRVLDRKYLAPRDESSWHVNSMIEVTYEYGMSPPFAGRRAARALANQIIKSRTDPQNCALPDRVTSVSRQGVSFTILDPQDFLADGRTGIYEVDLFLKATNPFKAASKARVFTSGVERVGYTIRTKELVRQVGEYDLVFKKGLPLNRVFRWISSGVPQRLTNEWTPTALVRSYGGAIILDLTQYLILEANNQIGRIDLSVPATQTAIMDNVQGTWALVLRRIGDPGEIVKLLEGDVWSEEL